MNNFFYSAADGRRQKPDSILAGGNVAGWQNNYSSALIRFCRAIAGNKIIIEILAKHTNK